jgi:hypothetical protein
MTINSIGMTRWAIEGCAREVRGEGGAAGDECVAKPDDDDDKIVALAPPAIKEITINQQWWQPVGTGGPGRGLRGR